MAVLTEQDRVDIWTAWMEELSSRREGIDLLKAEVRAAIDAIDDWVVANQASFNAALPLPAQTNLTAAQKAGLLMYVVQKRFLTGA